MKNNTLVFSLCYLLLLCSCQEQANKGIKHNDSFPVVIDTLVYKTAVREATRMMTANYTVLYIGAVKDTIIANYFLKTYVPPPPPPPPPPVGLSSKKKDIEDTVVYKYKTTKIGHPFEDYFLGWMEGGNYPIWDSSKIEILIDTSTLIKDVNLSSNILCAKAYPILLKNQELDTIYIGYRSFLPIILEAKDQKQNWKPIETIYRYGCGMGIIWIILPPEEVILTACPIYQGDFKTDLRLKLGNNYSKSFRGSINLAQFNKEYR